MHAFIIKVFKDGKLHHKGEGIAPRWSDLADNANKLYFPCTVSVMCDRNKQPQKEACHAH